MVKPRELGGRVAKIISPHYGTAEFLSALTGLPIAYQITIADHPIGWVVGNQHHRFDFKADFAQLKTKQEEINSWLKRVADAKESKSPYVCIINPGGRSDETIMTFTSNRFFCAQSIKDDLRCACLWQALERLDKSVESVVRTRSNYIVRVRRFPQSMLGDPVTLMFDVAGQKIQSRDDNGGTIYTIPSKIVDQEFASSPEKIGNLRF